MEEQKKQVGESFVKTKEVMFQLDFEDDYNFGKLRLQKNVN